MMPIKIIMNMTKPEQDYRDRLELMKIRGEIVDYRYEPFKLILVHAISKIRREMTYTPDFLVIKNDRFELHEVKGTWEIKKTRKRRVGWHEDARLKVKMAAESFPWFKVLAVHFDGMQWVKEFFN